MPLKKKYYIILIIILIGILFALISILFVILKKDAPTQNTQVFTLTQQNEENRITGKVEKIQGNTLLLKEIVNFQIPPSIEKKETFTITLIKDIQVTYPSPLSIPLIYRPNLTIPLKASINNIKRGQQVDIFLDKDSLKKTVPEFKAVLILLPPITNVIRGKITNIEGNILKVDGVVLHPTNSYENQEYRVTLNKNTEISGYLPLTNYEKPPQKVKYKVTDLKKNMFVTVYTNVDVEKSSEMIAYRIEPIPISNIPSSKEIDPKSVINITSPLK